MTVTAPPNIRATVGFRHCQLLKLSAFGQPLGTGLTAYEGIQLSGSQTLTITDPQFKKITYHGDDAVFALDLLPPDQALTGVLTSVKINDAIDALVTNVKAEVLGGTNFLLWGTDQRGFEPQVCMLAYREAVQVDPATGTFGGRVWDGILAPKTWLASRMTGLDANPAKQEYDVHPTLCTAFPWGTVFSLANENATRAQLIRSVSTGKPWLAAFLGDGTTTAFTLLTAPFDTNASRCIAAQTTPTGTVSTLTVSSISTTTVTFSSAPGSGNNVVLYYEV